MQTVQLYINNQRVDLFENETISLNSSIKNVRDISKVFTDFSKSFTVPASSTNNKIFRHYYNYSIDNGFDARKKETAKIELNSREFKDGKIKLEGVQLKNGKPESYKLVFFGNTVNLKDALGEDNLSSLDWLNRLTLDYNASTVQTALTTGITSTIDGVDYKVVAPLVSHTTRLYYDTNQEGTGNLNPSGTTMQGVPYTELKYGIPIKAIIKAIEEADYGIQFSTDFFNEANLSYSNLYMWMHRKKGNAFDTSTVTHQITSFEQNLSEMEEVVCYPDRLLVLNASQGVSYTLRVESNSSNPYTVIIKKDGQVFRTVTATNGLILETSGVLTNSSTGYSVFIQSDSIISEITAEWQITSIQYPESFTYTFGANPAESIGTTQSFIITEQMPEMKIIDFITGLFKMFNLTAYEEDGVIQVKTLDDYYDSSDVLTEITQYVDIESHTVDAALPFKEIKLEYEGLSTKLAKRHEQISNQGWGTGEYQGGDKFDASESIYTVKLPFEHMKYERLFDYDNTTLTDVQVGWFVDDNDSSYFGKPMLFYPILIETGTLIRFLNDSTYDNITDYYIPSNSVLIDYTENPDNTHFNLELNEYTFSEDYTGTLFEKYYKTYITDVFNSKLRISKYKAYFDLKFLLKYKLSDKVQILDRIYKINNINTNLQTGESDLELLNIANVSYESGDTSRLPAVTTQPQTVIDYSSAIFNGTITDKGSPIYTQRGFYWKVGAGDPTSSDNTIPVDFSTVDEFSFNKTDLAGSTTYSYRSFAINTKGPAYGNTIRFTTEAAPAVPQLTTLDATNRTETSFTMNANITNTGNPPYTEGNRGFYWKKYDGTPPTSSDTVVIVTGTGAGAFSHNLNASDGIDDDTTYSYVAFCENSESVIPSLGGVKQVTTIAYRVPVVTTDNETSKTETSFTMNATITDAGNPAYSDGDKGFYWKLGTGTPTASDYIKIVNGTGTGSYSQNLNASDGIAANTLYSYMAFCNNSEGPALGGVKEVTTSSFFLASVTTEEATNVTTSSARLNATVTNVGNLPYTDGQKGFWYIIGDQDPTGNNTTYVSGTGTGPYFLDITGLDENQFYSYKAFVINSEGPAEGVKQILRTTETLYIPTVSTSTPIFNQNSATFYGNVENVGNPSYTSKGFYLVDEDRDPTPSDTVITVDGTSAGSFNSDLITGLSSGTLYSVRAFCINSEGPALGITRKFTTSQFTTTINLPSVNVITNAVGSVYANTGAGFPASANGTTSDTLCVPIGNEGDAFEYDVDYVANADAEFTSLDNITNLQSTNPSVTVTKVGFTASVFTLRFSGTIGNLSTVANLSWSGAAESNTPIVESLDPTLVTSNSARINGEIIDVGNPNYTSKGFYWAEGSVIPSDQDNVITFNTPPFDIGAYFADLTGLNLPVYSYIAWAVGPASPNPSLGFPKEITMHYAPSVTTNTPIPLTPTSATFQGVITDEGLPAYTEKGFYYDIAPNNPTGTNKRVSTDVGDSFSFTETGLLENTTYNVRAFATNSVDTSVGDIQSFTTGETTFAPTALTSAATNLSAISATLNGQITNAGNPAYTDNNRGFYYIEGTGDPAIGGIRVDVSGTDTNPYSYSLSLLKDSTAYSFKAFASNGISPDPSFGQKQTFTTNSSYYALVRCYDGASGFVSVQNISSFSPQLGTLTRVVDSFGESYTVNGSSPTQGTINISDTGFDGCPTDLPRTYNVQQCIGSVTSTVNYESESQLSQGSTYWDGTQCWTILALDEYDANATDITGTTIYNNCSACTTANQYAPSVSTLAETDLTHEEVRLNGNLVDNGYPNVSEKGFVWIQASTGDPTTANNKIPVSGSIEGTYDFLLQSLTPETDYRYAAYAINTTGTVYGVTEPFTTDVAPVVCEGGTLYFNSSVITGINATLQTGNLSYGTGECGYLIPTLSLLFTNNEGEWQSTTQITSIQLFEGGVDVSSQYVLGKVLNGDVMTITLDGNFPDAFNDGDHFYEFRITAFDIPQFTTTITLPSTNAVDHATRVVTKNGSTQFPASRRDTLFNNSTLYPSGFDGDAYEYTITYTADAGYEFIGLGNITLAGTTGAGVNQIQDSYSSTTYTIKVYGTIQATDITGSVNWSGSAYADPATSYTKEYRFLGQSTWEAWPLAGVDIGSGATPVEVKITPDGGWASIQGANYSYLISSHSPTFDYTGDEVIMTVYFNTMGGADPDGSSSITITPRGSVTSLGGLRFNYFQPI